MSTRVAQLSRDVQTWAVLVAMLFVLAACGGGGSGVGVDGPPVAPTAGFVPLSATNPQNVVNQNNQGDVWVQVDFGPESSSAHTVTITIGDPATGQFVTAQAAATDGQGSSKVGPMNMRTMPDGSYPLVAEVTGTLGSSGEVTLGTVLKDTVFYTTPVGSSVAALPGGPQPNGTAIADVINLVNVGSTTVTTVWGADADDSLSFQVDLEDSQGTVATSGFFQAPEGAGNVDATNIDASGLAEGPVTVTVRVTDAGGNETTFIGTPAVKDVTVPSLVTVQVPQGGSNPADFINAQSQTSVTVRAILSNEFTSQESVSIELTDGANTVTAGPTQALTPEGPNSYELDFTDIDASTLADGLITLTGFSHDTNGNRVAFSGQWPVKDTVIGQATATLVAAGPSNPAGIVNIASQTQVFVDVTCDAQTEAGDTVIAHFLRSGNLIDSAPMAATGPGVLSVGPTNLQSLFDGSISVSATIQDAAGNSWTGAASVADKGTTAPTAPSFVRVAAGASNAVDVVNGFNASSATVDSQTGAGNDPSRTITFEATDGVSTVTQTVPAPTGGASISFSGIDFSGLLEGNFSLQCWTSDGFANPSTIVSASPLKDTIGPMAPKRVAVDAGGSNPQGYINAANAAATSITVYYPTPFEGGLSWQVVLTDSASGTVSSPTFMSPDIGGTQTFVINTSSLVDGPISIAWNSVDSAGNPGSYSSWSAIKDTVAAGTPSSLVVQAGQSNAASTINMNNELAVRVEATFGGSALGGGELFTVTLTPQGMSSPSVTFGPVAGGAIGGNAFVFGPMNATAIPEGNVDVHIDIADPAGNTASYLGSVAVKDVTPPAIATSASIPAGASNPADFINSVSESSVQVDVGVSAGSVATDQVTVALIGGTYTITSGPVAAPGGAGTMNFTGIDATALFDGPVAVQVTIEDVNQNAVTFSGTPATKDSVAPATPTSAFVAAGASNPQGFINTSNATTTDVSVVFPNPYETGGTWRYVLTDSGAGSVPSAWNPTSPTGGTSTVQVDSSSLADGNITISVEIVDAAGNPSAYPSWTATKDTVAAGAPASIGIAAGTNNPADVINQNNETAVFVQATFPTGALSGGELYTVTLTPQGLGSPAVTYGPIAGAAAGASTFTFGPMDSTVIPEGGVDISVQVDDPAGNSVTFAGTIGTKDITPPSAASSAGVVAGAMNAANIINISNVASIDVDVGFGASSVATDQVWVTLLGGAFSATAGPMSAPSGAGTLNFTGLNGSLLADGAVIVQVTVEDANGNQTIFSGAQALKDTVAPSSPTSAAVAATSSNPADFINMASAGEVAVAVALPTDYLGSEQVTVTLTGGATAAKTVNAPPFGGPINVAQIDATALTDGAVTVTVDVVDPAGNSVNFVGTPATKDTTPPTAPSALAVPMSASNPANVINNQTDGSVVVDVTYDGSMTGTETAVLTLTDASSDTPNSLSAGPVAVPSGGGMASFSGLNTTRLADGPITLRIDITDAQGNTVSFTGTTATKDTVGPALPLGANVVTTAGNPTNFINAASAGATQVDVMFDTGSSATDTATVTLAGTVTSGSMSAPAGAGTVSFAGINASGIADGNVVIQIDILDANMNLTTAFGTAATKDTVAPAAYTAAHIVAGPSNAQDVINASNVANARSLFTLPGSYSPNETIDVSLTDTSPASVSVTGLIAPFGGGNLSVNWPDLSGLLDGTLTVSFTATDVAGNQSTFALGTDPTKDTVAPLGPSALGIPVSAMNPVNVINNQTVTAVSCDVTYDASMDGTELATLVYSGAGASGADSIERRFGPFAVPASGGPATIAGANLSAFADGTVAISIEITDTAGNVGIYAGTPATKDTSAPAPPTVALVPMGGSNPANTINAATVASFQVDVTWDGTADATASAVVTVEDATNPVVSSAMAPNPGNTVMYTGLNGTLLAEGSHVIRVDVTDPNLNVTTFIGTAALKDTVAPTDPSLLQVAMGAGNAVDIINLSNYTSVTMDVTYDASMAGDETAQVTLTSGASVMSAVVNVPAGGGAATIGSIDCTGLTEGTNAVAMSITLTDPAGNSATFNAPVNATMDITPPVAPSAAQVVDTGGSINPPDYINNVSQNQVVVDTTMAAGATVGDQVALTLGGSGGMMLSPSPFTLTAPGVQTVTFSSMDVTAFAEGSVSLSFVITDAAGNTTPFTGTPATKDTVAPAMPTFAGVAATTNNPVNFVNLASETAVEVLMTFGATSLATDIVTLTIADTVPTAMNYGPTNATDGVGTLIFVNQDFSGLLDGALTVTVTVADLAGNSAMSSGNAATKDTVPPTAPVSWAIAAGGMNAADVVNSFSVNAVQMDVDYNGAPAGDESVNLTVTSSGGGQFQLATSPAAAAGVVMYSGNDFAAAGVTDGNLTLSGTIEDPAGNSVPFSGTAAVQDTVSPADPDSAFVASGASNAVNVINSASEGAVQVDVNFTTFDTSDQISLTLRDSMNNTVTAGPVASAATVMFSSLDTSGGALVEGSVAVEISITDANGNPATMYVGTAAIKDITAPDPASSSSVLANGLGNNVDWVSAASQGSVDIRVVLPGTYLASDFIDVSVDDNATTIMAMQQNAPAGGGNVDITGLDLTTLVDGQIDINITTTDQYGNSQTQLFNADKDVVAPANVTSAVVAAGASNPQDFINAASQGTVVVDVTYGGGADANDRATVSLSDGAALATSAQISASAGMTVSTAPFGATNLADGPIAMTVNLFDLAGNSGSFSGTSATKDVVVPNPAIVDPMPTPVTVTNQQVTGVSEPSHTVEVIVGGSPVATATSDALGSFIIPWTVPASSSTTFQVRATDAAGNQQVTDTAFDWNSTPLSVTHDATGPTIPWTDNTVTANLGDTGSVSGGSFVDVDNDGDLDLFVNETNRLWRNDGAGVYTDVTLTVGVIFVGDESAVWADYDADGDLDLWTTHSTLGSFLWQNDFIPSGTLTFSDATPGSGAAVGGVLRGASWFDYNSDGWADLISADADMLGNELLRNDGTSTFTSVFGSGMDPAISSPRWVCVGDLDGNGGIDLVIGDAAPSLQYMNNGSGAFTDMAGTGPGQSGFSADTSTTNGGIAMADLDNDGDLDIFVASGGTAGANQFWQNDGAGNFVDVAATAGCDTAANAYDVVIADFDNDGLQDIYLACNGANVLYHNQGDQVGPDGIPEFVDIAGDVGGLVNDGSDGRLCCAGDVDGDGDVDVFVGNEAVANVMYQNDLGNNFRYLKVKLVGKGAALSGSSPDAIGAQVRLEDASTGGNLLWRWVGSGRGAGADDPKTLHFGGIAPSRAYHVHITWPSGATQTLMNVIPAIQTNQTVTIVEL